MIGATVEDVFSVFKLTLHLNFFLKKSHTFDKWAKKGCHTHSNIYDCIYMWQILASENTSEFRDFCWQNTIRGGSASKCPLYINIKRALSSFPPFSRSFQFIEFISWIVGCAVSVKAKTPTATIKWWMICGR